jgi:hypothetical protein
MSILDDAIREHLELKRAHGADDQELKKLEDEAFGPPQRPDEVDPFAEAPTEFLAQPGEVAAGAPEIGDEAERSGRRPNITDLQEAPASGFFDAEAEEAPLPADAAPPVPIEDELSPAPDAPPPAPSDAADVPLPPPPGEASADLAPPAAEADAFAPGTPAPFAEEQAPAPEGFAPEAPAEAQAAPEPFPPSPEDEAQTPAPEAFAPETPADEQPAPDAFAPEAPAPPAADHDIADHGPDTEERHEIADQPTQMFDVQAHVDAEAAAESQELASPSDEELVDAAQDGPHAAPPAPADSGAPFVPPADEEEPSLFSDAPAEPEQQPLDTRGPDAEVAGHPPTEEESAEFDFFNEQRLSDELDQALEAPTQSERDVPQYEDGEDGGAGIFDFESQGRYEEDPSEEVLHRHDAREAESEEAPLDATVEQPRPNFDPPSEEEPRGDARADADAEEEDDYYYDPETGHEDVLEDTPGFLKDQDDDDLWFEQKPPKDFDLD